MGYLSEEGLRYLWNKITAYVDTHSGGGGNTGGTYTAGEGLEITNEDVINILNPVHGVLSQEEYNALSEEKKANGTYFIDDNLTPDISDFTIYDDQERVIGTWFGKPLYRKVFQIKTEASNVWTSIDLGFNVGYSYVYGFVYRTDALNSLVFLPGSLADSKYFLLQINDSDIVFTTNAPYLINSTGILVAEYTKITDETEVTTE